MRKHMVIQSKLSNKKHEQAEKLTAAWTGLFPVSMLAADFLTNAPSEACSLIKYDILNMKSKNRKRINFNDILNPS